MTDFCAERYWTLVAEMEVSSMDEFERMMQGAGQSSEAMKEFEAIMKGLPRARRIRPPRDLQDRRSIIEHVAQFPRGAA
jgi:hypothetical protein